MAALIQSLHSALAAIDTQQPCTVPAVLALNQKCVRTLKQLSEQHWACTPDMYHTYLKLNFTQQALAVLQWMCPLLESLQRPFDDLVLVPSRVVIGVIHAASGTVAERAVGDPVVWRTYKTTPTKAFQHLGPPEAVCSTFSRVYKAMLKALDLMDGCRPLIKATVLEHLAATLNNICHQMGHWYNTLRVAQLERDYRAVMLAVVDSKLHHVLAEGLARLVRLTPDDAGLPHELLLPYFQDALRAAQMLSQTTMNWMMTEMGGGLDKFGASLNAQQLSPALMKVIPSLATPAMIHLYTLALAEQVYKARVLHSPMSRITQQQGLMQLTAAEQKAASRLVLCPTFCRQYLQQHAPAWLACTEDAAMRKVIMSPHSSPEGVRYVHDINCLRLVSRLTAVNFDRSVTALSVEVLQVVLEAVELCERAGSQRSNGLWLAISELLAASTSPVHTQFAADCGGVLLTITSSLAEEAAALMAPAALAAAAAGAGDWVIQALVRSVSNCSEVLVEAWGGQLSWMNPRAASPEKNVLERADNPAEVFAYERYASGPLMAAYKPEHLEQLYGTIETILRAPALQGQDWSSLLRLLPTPVPLADLAYSSSSTSKAALSVIMTVTKWCLAGMAAVAAVAKAGGAPTAVAAAVAAAGIPGATGTAMAAAAAADPYKMLLLMQTASCILMKHGASGLTGAIAWADVGLPAVADVYKARWPVLQPPAGYGGAAWDAAVLAAAMVEASPIPYSIVNFPEEVLPNQPLGTMERLYLGITAMQAAAAQLQAAKLAKAAVEDAEQQQQAVMAALQQQLVPQDGLQQQTPAELLAAMQQLSCSGGTATPPAKPAASEDTAGAAAAAAAGDVPQLERAVTAQLAALRLAGAGSTALKDWPKLNTSIQERYKDKTRATKFHKQHAAAALLDLEAAVPPVVRWVTQLQPLLGRVLPLQALAAVDDMIIAGDISTVQQEQAAVQALAAVVIPGQPGCSNPACMNLSEPSEELLHTQACSGCRGPRYCCRACQLAHWKAGHKEVCKAVQDAVKAAVQAVKSQG